jgi:outer membrane protein assembly factor BamB
MNNMRDTTHSMNFITVSLLALGLAGPLLAADWPAYRGASADGVSREQIAVTRWAPSGPPVVWKVPTASGHSSFAVAGGKAFTLVLRPADGVDQEVCVALDAATGKELWAAPLGTLKINDGGESGTPDNKGGDGPRSTPAVDGDRVYVMSAKLVLSCFNTADGKVAWRKDLVQEHAGRNIGWQSAASPVLEGDLVFVAGGGAGQSFLGINKQSGQVVWKSQDEKITHATPILATIHGLRQVIFFMQSGLVSVAPSTGELLWRFKFDYRVSTAASPVVAGDIVYCSAGYGVGSAAARITRSGDTWQATELWRLRGDKPVANHWSTPVCRDGHLYGMFSFKEYGNGPMKCVELATGQVKWEQPGFGAGQVILVGNQVVALSDKGEVVLVDTSPTAYKELARADVLDGKCWSTPAFSNGRLYVRSTQEGTCLDLSDRK